MTTLKLEHVDKVYPNAKIKAVEDFNLDVKDKEFIVFVGPSGCGKSTTLRMIAGLEDITGGEFSIDNVRMNDVAPKDRDIAMVFQNYALYPHMTVFDNMAFGLKLRKYKKDDIKQRVEEAAASPWRPTRGSLTSPSYLVRNRTLGPPLENNPEIPPSSRAEGLRPLHGLATNLATSLQTPQEA